MRQMGQVCGSLRKFFVAAVLVAATAGMTATLAQAQVMARPGWAGSGVTVDPWWKHAVIYEIYPRSFQDSRTSADGDPGTGTLKGIASRLDYLQSLGVDAIWLTPIYPSPQVDFGYDISDYEAIDPAYGTMDDFDNLVQQAGRHNIRVILDMVMNHTSDQHPWFKESESSRTNPKRDWYIWREGRGCASIGAQTSAIGAQTFAATAPSAGSNAQPPAKPAPSSANPAPSSAQGCEEHPPNNWESIFGHSAWKYDATTKQWYFHQFYPQQPDLNWRNPAVEKAMFDVVRFWLNHGVAGFRLDAVTQLYEDTSLADAKTLPGKNAYGDPNVDNSLYTNLPEIHDMLRGLRKVVAGYPGERVLIGETYVDTPQELALMYGKNHDELQLPMDTQVGFINKLDAATFRQRINEAETELNGNQPLLVFDNHDRARSWDRYGDGAHNEAIARVIATVLLATRSTALMYYGEELGMKTTTPTRKEDVKDPIGILGWPLEKGRDGERTPMQWDGNLAAGHNAGFSVGKPWLPIPATAATVNAKDEAAKADSLLNWYKRLIQLRQSNHAFHDGTNVMLDHDSENVLAWLRKPPVGPSVLVACNFSAEPKTISVKADLKKAGVRGSFMRTILQSNKGMTPAMDADAVKLEPFGVYIGQVQF